MEGTHMSINGRTDKQNVVHIYSEKRLRLKKEENLSQVTTCMNPEDIMLTEESQTQKTSIILFRLYKATRSQIYRIREETGWFPRAGGNGKRELLFNGYSFSFVRWKGSGDRLHNNVNVLNTTELYA